MISNLRICRCDIEPCESVKRKLADLCCLNLEAIWTSITLPDTSRLQEHFYEQGILVPLSKRLGLTVQGFSMDGLREKSSNKCPIHLKVALVGKYEHQDAYISVCQALEHAALHFGVHLEISRMKPESLLTEHGTVSAVCIPGGFGHRSFEDLVQVATFCREEGLPFLGLCLGFQATIVALARCFFASPTATSQEVDAESEPPRAVIIKRRDGAMRRGAT